MLTHIAEGCKELLQGLNLSPPTIPSLPTEWSANSLWKAQDLEMLCVALHEDVENYLTFYWDAFSKSKGTWKPSKEDGPSPSFPDIAELHSHPEVFEVYYIAAHKALQ